VNALTFGLMKTLPAKCLLSRDWKSDGRSVRSIMGVVV